MIDRIQFSTGAAVGATGTGDATATGYSPPIAGEVLAVHVAYKDSPPAATTDVTLSDEADPAAENILSLPNTATDAKHYPRRAVQDNAGNDVTFDDTNEIYAPYVVHGRLKATIAQANDDDYAIITAWIRS
jgi:hypothetical protein